jgi:hypothetical protein
MAINNELYEKVEMLQNLLIAHATGSPGNEGEYRDLRRELLAIEDISDLIPSFVRTARSLDQFSAFIRKDRPHYVQRREFLWQSFAPIFDFLEREPNREVTNVESRSTELMSAPRIYKIKKINGKIRAFISYSTKDKAYGAQVKKILEAYGIECFLAHEDLEISEEWKIRILEELIQCDVFIALLSKAFRESEWAPQEVGVAISKQEVAIIPLSIDSTIPFGFISHVQGKHIPVDGVTESMIISPLVRRYPHTVIPGMIQKVSRSRSYRGAEAAMAPLVPLYPILNDDELDALVSASIGNGQVWSASLCNRDYLPKLIEMHRQRIDKDKLKILEYQVDNNERYPE